MTHRNFFFSKLSVIIRSGRRVRIVYVFLFIHSRQKGSVNGRLSLTVPAKENVDLINILFSQMVIGKWI